MKINLLTDSELLQRTENASKNEKEATLELLKYLLQVDERRAYAVLACSSLFEYVHKILGYSEMQTSERVNSVRLMRAVPEVEAKIESGELSMSTASQVHRFLRQEKKAGNLIDETEALNIIEACEGHSKRQIEKKLFSFSSVEAIVQSESVKIVSEEYTELKFSVPEVTYQKLKEVKNLLGNDSLQDIFDQALQSLLIQVRKKRGMTPKATFPGKSNAVGKSDALRNSEAYEKHSQTVLDVQDDTNRVNGSTFYASGLRSRYISIDAKRAVSLRSGNQCEFMNTTTKIRCDSHYRLQFDHYPVPFALGGANDASNLRHLCFQHNQKSAMESGLQS
jgi:hypothetical protein